MPPARILLIAALFCPLFPPLSTTHAAPAAPPLQPWIDLTTAGDTLNAPPGTYSGPVVIIRHDQIMHSVDASGSCIALKESGTTLIQGNEIIHCALDLLSDSPLHPISRTTVIDNRVADNVTGISVYGERGGHLVLPNRFEHNLWQALVGESSHIDDNEWWGNYRDNYEGSDQNGDGVGDTPYEIWAYAVQIWIETPMAKFFRRSPVLELLDFLERLAPFSLPTLILRDPEPKAHHGESASHLWQ